VRYLLADHVSDVRKHRLGGSPAHKVSDREGLRFSRLTKSKKRVSAHSGKDRTKRLGQPKCQANKGLRKSHKQNRNTRSDQAANRKQHKQWQKPAQSLKTCHRPCRPRIQRLPSGLLV
jgi:hypothetical protein